MPLRSGFLAAAVSVLGGIGLLSVLARAPDPAPSGLQVNQTPQSTTTSTSPGTTSTSSTPATASPTSPATTAPLATRPALPVAALKGTPPGKPPPKAPVATADMTVEQRGAAALALIDYPWTWTGYRILFSGPHDRFLGFTEGRTKQIDVYLQPGQSIAHIAWVTAHEIGHAVDFSMTTEQERADYRRIRALDGRPWFPDCQACNDSASPSGDWAETFAFWLLGNGPFASQLGPRPTAAQLNALGPLFAATPPAPPATTTTTTTTASSTTTTTRAPAGPPSPNPPPATGDDARNRGLLGGILG